MAFCLAIHAFLYVHEYDPIICETTVCKAAIDIDTSVLTRGFLMVLIYSTSNCRVIKGFTQVCGPLYFLISHSSSLFRFAARRLHGHSLSREHFNFNKVLEDLYTKYW